MGLELEREALRRIVSLDAARSALSSLRLAQEEVGARSAALLAIDDGRYVVSSATELSQVDLDHIAGAWSRGRATLLGGAAVATDDWGLAPFGNPVLGLLYLGGGDGLSLERMRTVTHQLAQVLEVAVAERSTPPLDEQHLSDEPMTRGRVAKHRLLLLLEHNGWNKARVARLLRITRPTLYRWLSIHAIRDPRDDDGA